MFLTSVFLILISSYLYLCLAYKKLDFKNNLGFIFLILLLFCQIILSFELLSIFKLISKNNFFIINISFFVSSLILWLRNDKPIYLPKIRDEAKKIINALKKDKVLMFLGICFIINIVSLVIIALFFPITSGDALNYYLSRCTNWIQNGTLSHYITTDTRELIMPINSELMYTWVLLFLENEIGISIFPFIFYINTIYIIYNFLGELGYCRRKRLWSIFVFSSFSIVYLEASNPISDLWAGSLLLTCIYLFFTAIKYNKLFLLYFSSLSLALAVGVKTTAIIAFPMLFIVLSIILYLYKKVNTMKQLSYFLLFLFINFLIFSSYNYILNFISYSNPVSNTAQFLINKFRGGIKGYLTNLIRYVFVMFDFSGIIDIFGFGKLIENLQDKFFALIGETRNSYTSPYFDNFFAFTSKRSLSRSYLGFIGLLTFYPVLIYSILIIFRKKISKKTILLATLTLFYIGNILIFSRVMVFTRFNMRYLLAFLVVASPILVYTYIRRNSNFYKLLITFFLFIYLVLVISFKPLLFSIAYFNYKINSHNNKNFIIYNNDEEKITNYLLKRNNIDKIGIMIYPQGNSVYYLQKLRLKGYHMENIVPDIIETYDISQYDYIVTMKDNFTSTNIENFSKNPIIPGLKYCEYKDWQGNIIEHGNPVIVICKISQMYFLENNFQLVNDISLKNYYLYRNMKNNNIKNTLIAL